MMKKNNIINLNPVIIDRKRERNCQCEHPQYSIDVTNREVRCTQCGNYVDPIDALMYLAEEWEQIEKWEERQKEIVRQLSKYKPWKKGLKRLEENIGRKGDKLPICPHCGKGFHLEEIKGFVWEGICSNKGYANKKEK